MILSCPTMPGRCPDDARTMPGNARKCPDDGRLFPVMFDEPVRPATALGVESGPTIRVRCAAGRHEDRYGGRHGTRTENGTGHGPRQRRHLHAAVGPHGMDSMTPMCFHVSCYSKNVPFTHPILPSLRRTSTHSFPLTMTEFPVSES